MSSLLTKFAPKAGTLQISCYRCGGRQEVGSRAQTVTCRHCNKPLQVSDVQIKKYDARREIKTVGTLVVEKKGRVVAKQVECGGLVARGEVRAGDKTIVRGLVMAGPKSSLGGTVEAHTVSISDGAQLDGYFVVGKDHMTPPPPPEPMEEEAMPDAASADTPAADPKSEPIEDEAAKMRRLMEITKRKPVGAK
jgi:cytoskeletal protein CcmA (bactofilin family)/ribosomal protein S27E